MGKKLSTAERAHAAKSDAQTQSPTTEKQATRLARKAAQVQGKRESKAAEQARKDAERQAAAQAKKDKATEKNAKRAQSAKDYTEQKRAEMEQTFDQKHKDFIAANPQFTPKQKPFYKKKSFIVGTTVVAVVVIGGVCVIMSPTAMAFVTAHAAAAKAALISAFDAGVALAQSAIAYGRTDLLPVISQFLTHVSNQITALVNAHPTAVKATAGTIATGLVAAGAYFGYKKYQATKPATDIDSEVAKRHGAELVL